MSFYSLYIFGFFKKYHKSLPDLILRHTQKTEILKSFYLNRASWNPFAFFLTITLQLTFTRIV